MDALPDDVLLAIFSLYLNEHSDEGSEKEKEDAWRSLVHVCRQWRSVVFGSPRHLDLQLVCTGRTPTRDTLDVWPALPLIIKVEGSEPIRSVDDIIAVLERSDRVCQIELLDFSSLNLETVLATIQQPFLELINLQISSDDETVAVVPDSCLGGFAPRLETLALQGIPFPGLPKLLLSATHLVILYLLNIPHSGYISPDGMVAALSTLTSLESLTLGFQSPRSCPDLATRNPPSSKRSVLPVLTFFQFKGVTEYLEDCVACIDTPRLSELSITFFNDVEFDTPQFVHLISRTPMLRLLENVHIKVSDEAAYVNFLSPTSGHENLRVEILCRGLEWQLSSVEQICNSCLPLLSMLEGLYIYRRPGWGQKWKGKIENGQWVELLRPFTAVKNLYLSRAFARRIAPALQELDGDRITEVLPALGNIFLERHVSSDAVDGGIGPFVAAREVAGHPVKISFLDDSEVPWYYRPD